MRTASLVFLTWALAGLSACGPTTETRAATGALGGAILAGPVGDAVGGAGGALVD